MASLIVTGGYPLSGTLRLSGAKNAALPILAASLLGEHITLADCPHILDVSNMLDILSDIGVKSSWNGEELSLDATGAHSCVMPQRLSKELRSSIFMLGPMLSRFGCAVCTYPGGCEIGHRPIDLHLRGLSLLGVQIREEYGQIVCDGQSMHPAEIHLDYPSVGATENIMMAAVRIKGETIIRNAAREPEIEDLQRFLCLLGYEVSGAGDSTISIRGKDTWKADVYHAVMPDRIVAGTLLCAAAITGGELTLTNARPQHLSAILSKLREAGCLAICSRSRIFLSAPEKLGEIKLIETLPYPGFPTDMQAQFFALCTLCEGTCVIVENVFENRFKHGAELLRMGAAFTQRDRTIVIRGVPALSGTTVTAHDLRGGAALVLAGLAAKGTTRVQQAQLIDRGYDSLEGMLQSLGAHIQREED
ncbi:MAG: UDP-N-acetylglucosamine 1-carboxyvinyltransferase [Clostridia bacterium]|nr:UDP-N-acetylglucosamine 1-carboxyvinyltransferase [Clostridia bacterium]